MRCYYADNPSGFLVLDEVPPAETLGSSATGTGIAPFLSILRTESPVADLPPRDPRPCERGRANELVYREPDRLRPGIQHGDQFRYVTFVSREEHPGSLEGRITGGDPRRPARGGGGDRSRPSARSSCCAATRTW
jgi:ferredoxin--NADP+ reductase